MSMDPESSIGSSALTPLNEEFESGPNTPTPQDSISTALQWFTRLGPKGRALFLTWSHWQEALRQRFLKANYLAEKKRLWKKRDLRSNEDMADYFDAKVDLQAYVFDENTPDSELILDVLEGLPDYMLPTLKSSITPDMDLLDFRRILLDYEKGLRWNGPWGNKKNDNVTPYRSPNASNDKAKPHSTFKDKDSSKPPRACSCGGMHWFRDCPKKNSKTNNVSSYRPATHPNKIPIAKSKWPNTDNRLKFKKEAHMNSVRTEDVEEQVIELCLPEQDNEGYEDLHHSLSNNAIAGDGNLQHRHANRVPTFAMANRNWWVYVARKVGGRVRE